MRRLLSISLLWAAFHMVAHAGTAAGGFLVTVTLNQGALNVCTSSSLSQQTNATVKVVCGSSQFVSIEPALNKSFVGVHGGAFAFNVHQNAPSTAAYSSISTTLQGVGAGTITALRMLNLNEQDEGLELLVSF